MFCPYCGNQVEENAKFCGACGKMLAMQQPENRTEQTDGCAPVPRRRRWKPWMTVLTVVLGTVLGTAAVWGLLISGINTVVHSFTMDYSDASSPESWIDSMLPDVAPADDHRKLMRTWSMVGSDYYGETIWWITFDEEELEIELQTSAGMEDYGSYSYVMVGENEFYITEVGQAYTFEINDGGNMLTISPGMLSNGMVEYWFSFG